MNYALKQRRAVSPCEDNTKKNLKISGLWTDFFWLRLGRTKGHSWSQYLQITLIPIRILTAQIR